MSKMTNTEYAFRINDGETKYAPSLGWLIIAVAEKGIKNGDLVRIYRKSRGQWKLEDNYYAGYKLASVSITNDGPMPETVYCPDCKGQQRFGHRCEAALERVRLAEEEKERRKDWDRSFNNLYEYRLR